MRRAFDIDVLACPRCGGRMRLIGTVEDPDAIRAILCCPRGVARAGGSGATVAASLDTSYAAVIDA